LYAEIGAEVEVKTYTTREGGGRERERESLGPGAVVWKEAKIDR